MHEPLIRLQKRLHCGGAPPEAHSGQKTCCSLGDVARGGRGPQTGLGTRGQAARGSAGTFSAQLQTDGKTPVQLLPGPYSVIPHHDPPLVLQIGRAPDGRLICTGLLVGWRDKPVEVTARALHQIRLGEILMGLAPLPEDGAAPRGRGKRSDLSPIPPWLLQQTPTVRPPHPGQAGHTDEHYQNVARLYEEALLVAAGRANEVAEQAASRGSRDRLQVAQRSGGARLSA